MVHGNRKTTFIKVPQNFCVVCVSRQTEITLLLSTCVSVCHTIICWPQPQLKQLNTPSCSLQHLSLLAATPNYSAHIDLGNKRHTSTSYTMLHVYCYLNIGDQSNQVSKWANQSNQVLYLMPDCINLLKKNTKNYCTSKFMGWRYILNSPQLIYKCTAILFPCNSAAPINLQHDHIKLHSTATLNYQGTIYTPLTLFEHHMKEYHYTENTITINKCLVC